MANIGRETEIIEIIPESSPVTVPTQPSSVPEPTPQIPTAPAEPEKVPA